MSGRSSSRASASRGKQESADPKGGASQEPRPLSDAVLASVLALLMPGAGHVLLGRWQRGLIFCGLVLTAVVTGTLLEGRLWWVWSGSPLSILASLGCLGMGLPCLILHFVLDYQGTATAVWYEHGSAFILTAGLMNLLLVLDAWDIARGLKS